MSVQRRFIITELRKRNFHPGDGYGPYSEAIFNFLVESLNTDKEALQEDKGSLEYLETQSTAISRNIREFMKFGKKKIKIDVILGPSSPHKVLKSLIYSLHNLENSLVSIAIS
mgnify:CR=1 FL=1